MEISSRSPAMISGIEKMGVRQDQCLDKGKALTGTGLDY